ncbi:YqeG family HAD IIIA-type phosphatase [Acetatifactor muris]|uniref:Phosphoglycolate phosphatase n=1 Tax=Acetatifactor muris TaxID=879566 RepID=A0A2K4ZEN0_9FIRM|nr:YqeG family HAD IIIA-type phosphatase [Acetatifactor muris]MCI8799070.1 YqeG family HAD IIIA-type phosphatase [Lachnospiraceae bacterium]MCR2048529.1 YqeG family HAD IIIA-type phosphatase [Acetatifactor muris]SOY28921.1 Phosphoglycolate phosphatase [Acetatifactor muris]
MLERFYPDRETESAYTINYQELYEKGYRGVIFDIDNTLVPHGAPADEKAVLFFRNLREIGLQTVLLSNNKEPRVKGFADAVGTGYLFKAGKPGRRGYEKAMEVMGTVPESTFFVGDQLFTDVWGAKKAGIFTWLVKPIHPKEEIQIVLKRCLERIVLYFYHRTPPSSGPRCRGGKSGDSKK